MNGSSHIPFFEIHKLLKAFPYFFGICEQLENLLQLMHDYTEMDYGPKWLM